MSVTANKLNYLKETKNLIKTALINKGQIVTDNTPFRNYASLIENISTSENLENILNEQDNLIATQNNTINNLLNTVNTISKTNMNTIKFNSEQEMRDTTNVGDDTYGIIEVDNITQSLFQYKNNNWNQLL